MDANWLDKILAEHIAWARRTFDRLQPYSTGITSTSWARRARTPTRQ
jgi:uncharacterized membrane protein YjdF